MDVPYGKSTPIELKGRAWHTAVLVLGLSGPDRARYLDEIKALDPTYHALVQKAIADTQFLSDTFAPDRDADTPHIVHGA